MRTIAFNSVRFRCRLLVILLVLAGPLAATDEIPAELPAYPAPIWDALLRPSGGTFLLRADGEQLLSLPEVRFYLDRGDSDEIHLLPLIRAMAEPARVLQPIAEAITEVVTADGVNLYFRSGLTRQDLMSNFQRYGWILVENEDGAPYLRQPLTEDDERSIRRTLEHQNRRRAAEAEERATLEAAAQSGDQRARDLLAERLEVEEMGLPDPEIAIDDIRAEHANRKWKVLPLEEGWASLLRPWASPSAEPVERPSPEALEDFRTFPLSVFLTEEPDDLLAIAILFPKPEPEPDADPAADEMESRDPHRAELERELRDLYREQSSLTGSDERAILDRIGDMLLRINEIDGGLDVDLTADIPGETRDTFTEEAIQMGLGILRMSVIAQSPQLALELLDTTIAVSGDRVRAGAALSHATLMDLIRQYDSDQRRLQDVRRRIEAIREEIRDLDETGP